MPSQKVKALKSFLLALQFLTRIPVSINFDVSGKQLGQSVLSYPLVGLLIGGLLAVIALLLSQSPLILSAALLLGFWIFITGGLHLDGLADCSDAWAGGLNNRERSLEIMKDPNVGAIGAVVLISLLLVKWSALFSFLEQQQSLWVLVLIPMLGRCSILALILFSNYIRENGLGAQLTRELPSQMAKTLLALCVVVSFLILGFIPTISAIVVLALIRGLAQQRLGGMTGDVYGAAVEITETTLLVSVVL